MFVYAPVAEGALSPPAGAASPIYDLIDEMSGEVALPQLCQQIDEMSRRLETLENMMDTDQQTIRRLSQQAAEMERKASAERELRISLSERVDHAFVAVEALGEEEVTMARQEAEIEAAEHRTERQLQTLVQTLTKSIERGAESHSKIEALSKRVEELEGALLEREKQVEMLESQTQS